MNEEDKTANAQVLCGKCKVPIQGPTEPTEDSIFKCPDCGASDTHADVMKEVGEYFHDTTARTLQSHMKKAARSSKMITYKGKDVADREYKFILSTI
ncbi:hypothetical protein [Phyllobacterium bourgognense]|uniref:Uncharacterized protein n=1 Tax=Phyllobacterium bourgognense TaxID=314236 RepID=A0A368YPU3_9HYPH|nr:hypothetical protein [Phyllobacterium bourgognense]RCW80937.1 hypothetical protein C7476_11293 [Phyllobacterium bourgognense]